MGPALEQKLELWSNVLKFDQQTPDNIFIKNCQFCLEVFSFIKQIKQSPILPRCGKVDLSNFLL